MDFHDSHVQNDCTLLVMSEVNRRMRMKCHTLLGMSHTGLRKRWIWYDRSVIGEVRYEEGYAVVWFNRGWGGKEIGRSYYHDPDFFDSVIELIGQVEVEHYK